MEKLTKYSTFEQLKLSDKNEDVINDENKKEFENFIKILQKNKINDIPPDGGKKWSDGRVV